MRIFTFICIDVHYYLTPSTYISTNKKEVDDDDDDDDKNYTLIK